FNHPKIFDFVGRIVRKLMLKSPRFLLYNRYNVWGKNRELPPSPKQSFKEWYRINRKANDGE
ncbi:MAG: 4Fe-4S ferredoxin, partial [Cyclobacteriaceae bacterium]